MHEAYAMICKLEGSRGLLMRHVIPATTLSKKERRRHTVPKKKMDVNSPVCNLPSLHFNFIHRSCAASDSKLWEHMSEPCDYACHRHILGLEID
jgi:hypothetical protein